MEFASAIISSDALTAQLAALAAAGRKALVCYITAGHPNPAASEELLSRLSEAGADVIELGVPFSDPLADGPTIQRSSQRALDHGTTLSSALDMVARVRPAAPVVLFTYLNPLLAAGPDVLERAREAGVAGVLVTDLPLGADPEREEWIASSGLAFVRLVAPTTPPERIRAIAEHGGGFVYVISRLGVTGARSELPPDVAETMRRVRAETDLPVCLGFGVSTPKQARAACAFADGVVVGSAIVEAAERGLDEALALVRAMREAMDS